MIFVLYLTYKAAHRYIIGSKNCSMFSLCMELPEARDKIWFSRRSGLIWKCRHAYLIFKDSVSYGSDEEIFLNNQLRQ